MSISFAQCLEATIQHLETLKARGLAYVPVSPETLKAMKASGTRSPASAVPKAPKPVPRPVAATSPLSATANPSRPQPSKPVAGVPSAPLPVAVSLFADAVEPSVLPSALAALGLSVSEASRDATVQELRRRVLACEKCPHLVRSRKNVVFGVGSMQAELMFVGEAPGADEDEQGEPFVGKAGQLLTRIIQTMGFTRESVFIANILKCRPDTPGQASGNRKPTSDEMATCLPYLLAQIELIKPRVIVALGATAVEGLLGKTIGITKLRGHFQTFRNIPLMPTYHPAYLLRNQSLAVKREVWEDMLQVLEKLGQPISDKQRGYFLKAP